MNLLLIDFEDSFTYNIASDFKKLNSFKVNIVKWNELNFADIKLTNIICLGPGPGKPKDYNKIYPLVKKALDNPLIYMYGICLGHQIIGELKGFELIKCQKPLHGVAKKYNLNAKWRQLLNIETNHIKVQHYNSLCLKNKYHPSIKTLSYHDEILLMKGERFISYQFHPESIGTDDSELFFRFRGSCDR